jgi:hypothetical protein
MLQLVVRDHLRTKFKSTCTTAHVDDNTGKVQLDTSVESIPICGGFDVGESLRSNFETITQFPNRSSSRRFTSSQGIECSG